MSDGNQEGLGKVGVALSLPIVLLLAVVFGGLRDTDKPKAPRDTGSGTGSVENIPAGPGLYSQHARLWDDPLEYAVEAEKVLTAFDADAHGLRAKRLENILQSVANLDKVKAEARSEQEQRDRDPGGLLILPVMVPGGNASDAVRDRTQTREAVVQALMSRGYRLQYPNRLSYMRVAFRIAFGTDRDVVHSIVVPLKLYQYHSSMEDGGKADPRGYRSVLVFWIDQDQLGSQPLSSIAQIVIAAFINTYPNAKAADEPTEMAAMQRVFGAVATAKVGVNAMPEPDAEMARIFATLKPLLKEHADLAIIGPRNSDGLFAMIRDDKSWDDKYEIELPARQPGVSQKRHEEDSKETLDEELAVQPFKLRSRYFKEIFRSARVYSTRSTVDRRSMVLSDDLRIPDEIRGGGRLSLHDCGLELIHFVGTDVVLAETIKEELQIRRKWPTPDAGRMILVTERESLYGALADRAYLYVGVPRNRCHVIRYLQAGGNKGGLVDVDPLTQIRGQLDQLEQEKVVARDVMSIGVLGSSVEAKVELLEYVRKRFPAAVLFTTDLNDGLFRQGGPKEIRNTIVASHFGLSLNPQLNIEAPAFETGYQTATFAAVLTLLRSPRLGKALGPIADDPWGRRVETARKREPLRPVLYELGRYAPVQLSLRDQSAALTEQMPQSIQPHAPSRWSDKPATWVFLGLLVLLFLLIVWLLAQVEKRAELVVASVLESARRLVQIGREVATLPTEQPLIHRRSVFHFTEVAVVISIVALFLLFAAGIISDQRRTGEPINFVDGVSVWPSIWLLGLIGATAFSMLPNTRRRLRREANYVKRHKVPPAALVDDKGQPTSLAAVSLKIREILDGYEKHLRRGDAGKIATISLVLAFIGSLAIYLMGVDPSAPARGLLAIETALFVQIVVALILVAYVCQATYSVFVAREACTDLIKKNTLYIESIVDQRVRRQIGAVEKPEPVWDEEMQKTVVRQANVAMHLTEMIANHTRVVSRPVEHAALFVLLFGLARTSVFDAWENSAPALSLLLVILAVCIGSLWLIRTNLARRRSELVTALNRLAISVEVDEGDTSNREAAAKLRQIADAIDGIRKGVFRSISSDPIFRAVIYASGALITAANQWLSSNLGN